MKTSHREILLLIGMENLFGDTQALDGGQCVAAGQPCPGLCLLSLDAFMLPPQVANHSRGLVVPKTESILSESSGRHHLPGLVSSGMSAKTEYGTFSLPGG